jgi:putative intracellular protease/amidase
MKHVAMVVSTVGFHWEEVFSAYWEFRQAGWGVELYSVGGMPARPDPMSLRITGPGALAGLGISPFIAPATTRGRALSAALDEIRPIDRLDPSSLDTLYLPGGHGCLFDVNRDAVVHEVVLRMHEEGRVLGAVCHATSTFAFVERRGRSIVAGHRMTGFPHALDRALIPLGLVHEEFLPLPLVNDDELRRAGAVLSHVDEWLAVADPRLMRVSLPFVTGMGPKAAGKVARKMMAIVESGAATTVRKAA